MSERLIPKERLSAYQRWEMASFDPPQLNAVDPVEAARAAAQEEGYAAGYTEGTSAGHADGYDAGRAEGFDSGLADARAHAEQLAALVTAFTAAADALDAEMSESLMTLSLDIARSVIRQTVQTDTTVLLGAVREVLSAEPPLVGAPILLVNPADLPLLDAYLAGELASAGWSVRGEAAIARGGCRARAGSGEIDATLATRWSRVTAALGRENGW